ncbi:MAG: 50S ribosomal protein L18 [Bacilli bacterium]|nr:50S ribosomal protein L18 [Bacilli bacterium]
MITKKDKNISRVRRHARVRAKVSGTSEAPRLCVYRSNKNIEAQIIDDTKGMTLVASSSTALKLENGSNIEAAAQVGKDIAEKALAKKIKKVVFDRSGYIYHGRVKALAEAAREAGLDF